MQAERFQLLLKPDQVALLRQESKRSGRSMSELIRTAIDVTYSDRRREQARDTLQELFSLNLPVADWPEMEREIERARRR